MNKLQNTSVEDQLRMKNLTSCAKVYSGKKRNIKILLILNKPNREIPIMESIRCEVLSINPDATVEIREMFSPGFNRFVFKYKPDVIMTFPFTCKGFARWYYVFKFFLGVKIISFRAEGVIDFNFDYSLEWACGFDQYGKTLVDYEVFWGRKTAHAVGGQLFHKDKISSMERIKVIGYPRLEHYFNKRSDKESRLPVRLKQRLTPYSKGKVVLLITGFHLANYTQQNLFDAKDLDAENKLDELLDAVERSKQFRSEWITGIIAAAQENPDVLFIMKKHPIEKKEDYAAIDGIDNILYVYEDIQVNDIIHYAGVLFHYGSTALVDAYLSQIPSVYVYSQKNKSWYSDLGWPSSEKIEVGDIPVTVKRFLSGNLSFTMTPDIKRELKDIFNIEIGKPYLPSKGIAGLLLDAAPAQKIPLTDVYLWKALLLTMYHVSREAAGRFVKRVLGMSPDVPFFAKMRKLNGDRDTLYNCGVVNKKNI